MTIADFGSSPEALGSLGSNRRLRKADEKSEHSPLDPEAVISRLRKWALQSAAREIMQSKALNSCCRTPIQMGTVVVVKSKVGTYSYNGLMTCGSVWRCPICASKITELRRQDLQRGMDNWIAAGHGVMLLTLTVPHYARDKCQDVLDGRRRVIPATVRVDAEFLDLVELRLSVRLHLVEHSNACLLSLGKDA